MSSNKKITGSEIIARSLQLEGVENIFTLVGDHILPVTDTIGSSGFRIIDTRHEQAAVHLADAWGRITGKPGVAMYTTPGFANAIPGLACALHDESPVLSISGSAELTELGRGAMQEIEQVDMARPVTKGAWLVTDSRRIPDMIAHALRVAYSGRRGPVHLTIPVDIQQQSVSVDEVNFFEPFSHLESPQITADSDQVRRAIDLLRSASNPIVIAGSAAAYGEPIEQLTRFIETTHIPLMTEGDARGLLPDDHEYCMGFFDHGLNQAARLLKESDVVMLLGRKQDVILGYAMPPTISPDTKIIQIDPSSTEIGRNKSVSVGIAGNVGNILEQLTSMAAKYDWADLPWLTRLRSERTLQLNQLNSLAVPESPMHAMSVHKALAQFLKTDDCLVFDGGDFCHFGRAFHGAFKPNRWLYLGTLGMLGSALPTALAAKLANPERRVILMVGDGAFGFNAMEYDTAVRHNIPIIGILGNDAAWGIDRQIQLGLYGKAVATDLLPTRYDQVVNGLGGYGEHVKDPGKLDESIDRAFKSGKPSLLNVEIQRAISPRAEASISRWRNKGALPF
jgi:acetolactate synthase-1/2/3 large subunit